MRSTGTLVLLVLLLVVGMAGCAGCSTYNSLVAQDEQVERSWADVENQYQRRADLVPNLVRTVQGAADFESETLQNVIEARSRAVSVQLTPEQLSDPDAMRQFQENQGALGAALGSLISVVREDYPELGATDAFRDLQTQLEGTENRIATARRDYNAEVGNLNGRVRQFPANLVAGVAGVERRVPFAAAEGAETPPTVSFE